MQEPHRGVDAQSRPNMLEAAGPLGVRRQIDRDALAAMQGAGSTRTGPISRQPISDALHGKRLSPHQRRSLRGVITGGHWTQ
eukprot:1516958-Pyramimonas_sp.AAC.1